MIPEYLKNRIEIKFGRAVKYPKDCVALAFEINKVCNEKISQTTLLRFFGLINEPCNPRLHTLDVIAQYAGFECWRDVISEDYLSRSRPKFKRVKLSTIGIGYNIYIVFGESAITLRHLGDGFFIVVKSGKCSLEEGDHVKILRLEYGYPFVCESVERSEKQLGPFVSINDDTISLIEEDSSGDIPVGMKQTSKNGIDTI
jgi:hypothetical protein